MTVSAVVEHDGKQFLVLRVRGDEDFSLDDYDVAVIELSEELLRQLLSRLDAVVAMKAADQELMAVEWIDFSPEYHHGDWEVDPIDDDDTPPPVWEIGDLDGRTEVDLLYVSAYGRLWWTATVKHTSWHIETDALERTDLVGLLQKVHDGIRVQD